MSEKPIKIEQADIIVPSLKVGETALVFQRHGEYNRDRDAAGAGSLLKESADTITEADKQWFMDLLANPDNRDNTFVLFVSSDTRYAGKGFRSLETGQLAQDAAVQVMEDLGINLKERIINLNLSFKMARSTETDQNIRPMPGIREPEIFNPADAEYLHYLQVTYGYADKIAQTGISPRGWAFHEMDAEIEARKKTNAEGQEELIDRTKTSLALLERYSRVWHATNPGKKLVIWATSHYDTINPLVKEINGELREEDGSLADTYQPVDYGGGIVIKFSGDKNATVETRRHHGRELEVGRTATRHSVTSLGQPRY